MAGHNRHSVAGHHKLVVDGPSGLRVEGRFLEGHVIAPPLLFLQDIALSFGGPPLLEHADLSIAPGERACLVGRNGSGKSTLLKIAAELVAPDRGTRFVQPGATIRYLPQEPDLSGFATALAYVEAGLTPGDDPHRARYLLEQLGLEGGEAPDRLSGGEARRCALARVLAPEPDILLLDEPTNHLDIAAIEWLEAELKGLRSALVLISHDRRFLDNLAQATIWLDRGATRRMDLGFAHFEAWRDEIVEAEARDRHKLDRKIADEADWLRYGVTARRKRNTRRLAELHTMRTEFAEQRRAAGSVRMTLSDMEVSGKLVVEADAISKSFGAMPVVKEVSIRVMRGDRLGIVGPNGAGKTTLLNLLTGAITPDAGTVRLGANLDIVTLDQQRKALDPDATVAETLTGGKGEWVSLGGERKHVIGYMKDFLFGPEQARTPVRVLSGGERNRLLLARALARPSNLLVLDEPTNDLDLETLDRLQEALGDYAGTVLLVSHDRDFLDRTVSSTMVAEGEGRWVEYAGGYADMLAQRGQAVGRRAPLRPAEKAGSNGSASARTAVEPKRKLSFNDQHALKMLPTQMDELQQTVDRLEAVLADPELYARDPRRFEKASMAFAQARMELSAAEDRWLALEILRAELEL